MEKCIFSIRIGSDFRLSPLPGWQGDQIAVEKGICITCSSAAKHRNSFGESRKAIAVAVRILRIIGCRGYAGLSIYDEFQDFIVQSAAIISNVRYSV
jgi:hypothetical protein